MSPRVTASSRSAASKREAGANETATAKLYWLARRGFRYWIVCEIVAACFSFIVPFVLWLGFGWTPQDLIHLFHLDSVFVSRGDGSIK
jgi:hypothetical protein